MELYHGTNAEFTLFKLPEEIVQHEYFGKAIYFSDNYHVASYYGKRLIAVNIPDESITCVIDAANEAIRTVEGLRDIVAAGGVIKVENTADCNLEGAQCKWFPIDAVDCEEYIYFVKYVLPIKGYKKKDADAIINILNECGVPTNVSKNKILRNYHIYTFTNVSEEQVRMCEERGVIFQKIMKRTPDTATTVIFAGQQGLDVLNLAINE